MVQFNLLPDVKIDYIKAKRFKRLIALISLIVIGGSVAVVVLLATIVYGVQGAQIALINKEIKASKAAIADQNKKVSIDKILTVQNQLNSLDALHANKPIFSRVFDYLTKVVPTQAPISKLSIAATDESLTIQGSTDTIESVNKFVDILKFSLYKADANSDGVPAFSNVVLSSFGRDKQGASYSITMKYNKVIFDAANDGKGLIVPKKTTTRSELERPVFQTDSEKANNAPAAGGN